MHIYMTVFWFYCVLFFALFFMVLARKFKSSKGLFLLRLRVLQAVYSNPEIKAKVEDEVGAPLGSVPPLPTVALKMLSREGRMQQLRKRQRFRNMMYIVMAFFALDAFGFLPECWPLFVMVGCCMFMVVRMVSICFAKPEVRECKCCCCGGSTLDVENGLVSEAQACCKCCKGSGICAVKCKTCCGTAGKKGGAGSCCGGNCSCAKDNNCDGSCGCCGDSKMACTMKTSDDCKCCCCGGSALAAQNGTLTDAQACCNCCKGSGVCSAKCKSCCGGGSCCCKGNCGCCGDSKMACTMKASDDCKCCCCGGSALAAKNGTLTDAQACCNCCKGSGVCSANCKNCCGGGSCCCKGNCGCCGDTKMACTMKTSDDCNCCCCGGSALAAKNGTLTDAQACCNCCEGSGVCSAKCKSCCGGGSCCCKGNCGCCGDSKKKGAVVGPDTVVYHGVPIQIV